MGLIHLGEQVISWLVSPKVQIPEAHAGKGPFLWAGLCLGVFGELVSHVRACELGH